MSSCFTEEEIWMANKDIKICSTSLVILKMEIKTTGHHCVSAKLGKIKYDHICKQDHKCCRGIEACTLLTGVWIDATTLESNLSFAGEVDQEHSQGHTHLRACLVWVILFCLTQPTVGWYLLQVFFRWSFLPALPASFLLRHTSLPLLLSHSARGLASSGFRPTPEITFLQAPLPPSHFLPSLPVCVPNHQ